MMRRSAALYSEKKSLTGAGCHQNRVQTDSNNESADKNAALSIVSRPLTATIIATLMPAATSVHTLAEVAPGAELERMYFIVPQAQIFPDAKILIQQIKQLVK